MVKQIKQVKKVIKLVNYKAAKFVESFSALPCFSEGRKRSEAKFFAKLQILILHSLASDGDANFELQS